MNLQITNPRQMVGAQEVRLSVCMIVRDSARTLPAALESIRPWADEMVAVDTGSTDNTSEIAHKFGARVFHFPWCDDFSAARNESLKHAQGSWLFWMDSDDTIDAENGRKLRTLVNGLDENSPMAYVAQVHCPGTSEDHPRDVTIVDQVKLFRNHSELRFEGRIHEQILPAIRRQSGTVGWTDIFVVHSGSDQTTEGRRRKQLRDLRILKIELSENPDHPFVLFNLGMTYGDMDCHIEAIEHLEKCIQISSAGESHVRKAYALLVSSLTELNRCDDAWARLTQAIADFPNDPELQFRKGLVAHRLNRLAEAANAYRNAIANRDERHFSSIDRSLTGYKARQNLAIVLEEQGKLDLAEIQWRRVLDELPSYRPPWRGLSECLLKQKKLKTLQVELEQIPNERPLLCESAIQRYLIAKASGDLAEASRQLGQAAHILPDDIHLLRCRCHFLFDNGNPDEAIQALSELCRREPNDGAAHHNLGLACLRANRTGAAKVAFENSLAVRPNHSLTQQLLASLPAG